MPYAPPKASSRRPALRGLDGYQGHAFYKSGRWRRFRAWYLKRHPMCTDPFSHHARELGGTVPASVVDHVTPRVQLPPERWLAESECQALCRSCHSTKTARELHADGRWGGRIVAQGRDPVTTPGVEQENAGVSSGSRRASSDAAGSRGLPSDGGGP